MELRNVAATAVDLDPYTLQLVNGSDRRDLPDGRPACGGARARRALRRVRQRGGRGELRPRRHAGDQPASRTGIRTPSPSASAARWSTPSPTRARSRATPRARPARRRTPADAGQSLARVPDGCDTDENGADFRARRGHARRVQRRAARAAAPGDAAPAVLATHARGRRLRRRDGRLALRDVQRAGERGRRRLRAHVHDGAHDRARPRRAPTGRRSRSIPRPSSAARRALHADRARRRRARRRRRRPAGRDGGRRDARPSPSPASRACGSTTSRAGSTARPTRAARSRRSRAWSPPSAPAASGCRTRGPTTTRAPPRGSSSSAAAGRRSGRRSLVDGLVEEFRPGGDANNLTTTELSIPVVTPGGSGTVAPTPDRQGRPAAAAALHRQRLGGRRRAQPGLRPLAGRDRLPREPRGHARGDPQAGRRRADEQLRRAAGGRRRRRGAAHRARRRDRPPERLQPGAHHPRRRDRRPARRERRRRARRARCGRSSTTRSPTTSTCSRPRRRGSTAACGARSRGRRGATSSSVGSMNVENLTFVDADEAKFERLARILVENMRSPDIVGRRGGPGQRRRDEQRAVTDATQTWQRFIAQGRGGRRPGLRVPPDRPGGRPGRRAAGRQHPRRLPVPDRPRARLRRPAGRDGDERDRGGRRPVRPRADVQPGPPRSRRPGVRRPAASRSRASSAGGARR